MEAVPAGLTCVTQPMAPAYQPPSSSSRDREIDATAPCGRAVGSITYLCATGEDELESGCLACGGLGCGLCTGRKSNCFKDWREQGGHLRASILDVHKAPGHTTNKERNNPEVIMRHEAADGDTIGKKFSVNAKVFCDTREESRSARSSKSESSEEHVEGGCQGCGGIGCGLCVGRVSHPLRHEGHTEGCQACGDLGCGLCTGRKSINIPRNRATTDYPKSKDVRESLDFDKAPSLRRVQTSPANTGFGTRKSDVSNSDKNPVEPPRARPPIMIEATDVRRDTQGSEQTEGGCMACGGSGCNLCIGRKSVDANSDFVESFLQASKTERESVFSQRYTQLNFWKDGSPPSSTQASPISSALAPVKSPLKSAMKSSCKLEKSANALGGNISSSPDSFPKDGRQIVEQSTSPCSQQSTGLSAGSAAMTLVGKSTVMQPERSVENDNDLDKLLAEFAPADQEEPHQTSSSSTEGSDSDSSSGSDSDEDDGDESDEQRAGVVAPQATDKTTDKLVHRPQAKSRSRPQGVLTSDSEASEENDLPLPE
eukprot:gnl/MRDRNA2_/MRDRNA2_108016_c0_seq2.p1 gnl/MRDRNA2_/MRDRNA2_108016_c0~~gnl/MRDRNA2_/MRDRNA2_108016_c0_seq2.p1  ORF type:complete len:623 (+),score=122.89 gnl/MRDRNA2_/MRDRNA2_108016_c0_seq2:249-1871(+)